MPSKKQSPVIIKKSVCHSAIDGTIGSKVIELQIEENGLFVVSLPRYVADTLKLQAFLACETAKAAVEHYESTAEQYSRVRLAINTGVDRLWIGAQVLSPFAKQAFGLNASVGLGMRAGKVYEDPSHGQVFVETDEAGNPIPNGDAVNVDVMKPVLVENTPEIRMKMLSLIASLTEAQSVVEGIRETADPASYIMAITDKWQRQLDLFADKPTDSTIAPAPAPSPSPTSDDDEEL